MTHTPGAYYHKGIKEIVITSADERYVFSGEDGGFAVGILTPDDIDLLVDIYEDRTTKTMTDAEVAAEMWHAKYYALYAAKAIESGVTDPEYATAAYYQFRDADVWTRFHESEGL